ncbi:hypothetical protein TbgDal_II2400 [Trypanosoma brucei gambiense DAL972]|uniref:Uncharacterized protein n=1 Tax=Trypanosoma brucei gambiense (strain MHOM/CI/86/DAL972) TaxID=679716 RepID=C9ZJD7_TRYB9|nr:hypothetical protein TbgDal_II2400 [Trypanosoma brucei gambiense DAL972]CBH09496.1 hypothetical protein TbgDal_II2400 [Trypanosoma brucei gambiense DAL972]|eukprot:XP_011771801.1 hypothetical protein TbgDal_II2400 [Trypanosoma brucei gambiense DAL972]
MSVMLLHFRHALHYYFTLFTYIYLCIYVSCRFFFVQFPTHDENLSPRFILLGICMAVVSLTNDCYYMFFLFFEQKQNQQQKPFPLPSCGCCGGVTGDSTGSGFCYLPTSYAVVPHFKQLYYFLFPHVYLCVVELHFLLRLHLMCFCFLLTSSSLRPTIDYYYYYYFVCLKHKLQLLGVSLQEQ